MKGKSLLRKWSPSLLVLLLLLFNVISCDNILAPVVTVAIDDGSEVPGGAVTVSVNVSKVTGLKIVSCYLSVGFNTHLLTVSKVTAGRLVPLDWDIESHPNDELVITMNGDEPLTGNGSLVNIHFVVSNEASTGDTCTLELLSCEFNECKVLSALSNGLFTVASGPPHFTISGYVRDTFGTPIDGVIMTLSGDASDTYTTLGSGYYEFTGLVAGNYTVKPGKSGWTFEPDSMSYKPLDKDTTQDYIGTYISYYSISGYVRDTYGTPIDGVIMTLSGDASDTYTTLGSGYYEFTGLAGGNYTVKPSKSGWTFEPDSTSYKPLDKDTTQDYIGTYVSCYIISGYVRDTYGTPIDGVIMNLSGDASDTYTTLGSGYYEFTGLVAGDYTVKPSKSGWTFEPHSTSYKPLDKDTTQDYVGTHITYSISGYVRDTYGTPIDGVIMTLSGDASGTYTTLGSGYYEFTGLATGNYTVKPSKSGWTFEPDSMSYRPLDKDTTQDYVGTRITYSISGYVRDTYGTPIDGVIMNLSGDASDTYTTLGSGYYEFTGLVAGDYTVKPSKSGWTFEPDSTSYKPLDKDTTQDYIGTRITYSISGYVRDKADAPIDSVIITLSGDVSDTYITGGSGYYEFSSLLPGNYIVKPEKCGWIFDPDTTPYEPLNKDTTQDYIGIPITPVDVWLPDTTKGAPGDTILVPIYVGDVDGAKITEIEIQLTFDETMVAPCCANVGDCITSDWGIEKDTSAGEIIIRMTGTNPSKGNCVLVYVCFVIDASAVPCQLINVHFEKCEFNKGCVPTDPKDGGIKIIPGP